MSTQQTTSRLTVDDVVAAIRKVTRGRGGDDDGAITAATRLADLEIDSLDVAEVLVTLEDRAGCELDSESLTDAATVADLVDLRPL